MDVSPLYGAPVGTAKLKAEPEDFLVDEILGFTPSGEGEHCFVLIEKRGLTSNEVSGLFAEALGIKKRLISHCGLKDKQALTKQWFSIHLPGQESPERGQLEREGIRVVEMMRGQRKLRRGIHQGNQFELRLKSVDVPSKAAVEERWAKICSGGVPNYFGDQRFGKGGGNLDQVRRLFRGESEVRDRLFRGLLLSSARSALFNGFIARRIDLGIWDRPLSGEVYGFASNRSLILPAKHRGDELERFGRGEIEITAPLWGAGELLSEGEVLAMESSPPDVELAEGLEQEGLRQERRSVRLFPENPALAWESSETLRLSFSLPKGGFATTILRELLLCS